MTTRLRYEEISGEFQARDADRFSSARPIFAIALLEITYRSPPSQADRMFLSSPQAA